LSSRSIIVAGYPMSLPLLDSPDVSRSHPGGDAQ
jgi:hypothetical protein